jgi:hypothetical protein
MAQTYAQQVAQWNAEMRQQSVQLEREETQQAWKDSHAEASARREQAREAGDVEEWRAADSEMRAIEQDYAQQYPVNPQAQWWNNCTPKEQEFCRKNPLFNKLSFDQAANIMTLASQHALRLGAPRDSEEYFELARRSLEMHLNKEQHGVDYDRSEESLTPTEAAKISGLSPQAYNRNAQRLAAENRTGPGYWRGQQKT